MKHSIAYTCLLAATVSLNAFATTITVTSNDQAGEGFYETDEALPAQIGNNPGTNLGEMRFNVFNAAAAVWENLLDSDVEIVVEASFALADDCDASGGVLGSASVLSTFANFGGAAIADVSYHAPLAEAIKGSDLTGGPPEILAFFNVSVDDDPDCFTSKIGFYYGLDGNAPADTIDLFPVVLHELAHGLGFSSFANVHPQNDGDFVTPFPDTFSRQLKDLETGKTWDNMSNAERKASALNDPDLVWNGAQVTSVRGDFLDGVPELTINAPPDIAGTFDVSLGDEPTIVLPDDGVTASLVDADALGLITFVDPDCIVQPDPGGLGGKFLLFDLNSNCSALLQAYISETFYGAAGVIVRNTAASGLPDISGTSDDWALTNPYIGVERSVGDDLRANIDTANATIARSSSERLGENSGMVRMYAPANFESGSSVSHFTSDARPDLLMEPKQGALEHAEVDLTLPAFIDIGWPVIIVDESFIFEDGFEDP